ncbi:10627_t:CDS:1 [Acaulospora colombiana]|uniref:10627_t:CDS:1 n=1 Tax=Acaulospora colombiana TaxID=27376 RepID=A0ACA9K3M6_9GLOM|nr:10627_t:CDS:1 [Acaulospora colombiana]
MEQLNHSHVPRSRSHEEDSSIYLSTEIFDSPKTPPSRSRTIKPNFKNISKEYLDNIINSVLTRDERNKYESKLFLPLYDLILPSSRPRHTMRRYQNNFITFRKDYHARMVAEYGPRIGSRVKEISRGASSMWEKFSPEDRYMYYRIAECTKKLRDNMWPDHNVSKPTRKNTIKYSNYGYGEVKGCSTMLFGTRPNNPPSVNDNDSLDRISGNQNFIYKIFTSKLKPIEQNRSMTQSKVNIMSSYDKSLVDLVNKHVRI